MSDLMVWVFSTVLVAVAAALICQILFYKTKKAVWLPGCLTGSVFPMLVLLALHDAGATWDGSDFSLIFEWFLVLSVPGFLCGLFVSAIVGGVLKIFRK